MKCIHHTSKDAVAICCGCGRALCPNCLRMTADFETVCSQRCADRRAARSAVQSVLIAEIAVKVRSYLRLVLVFRLMGGFCFLFALGIGIAEYQEAPFNRLPLAAVMTFIGVLLGLSTACTIAARGLDRQTRESQTLLTERSRFASDSDREQSR